MIDSKGRLFSKISVIDLLVVLVLLGLCAGLAVKLMSSETQQIVSSNTTFYTTFMVEKVRDYSVEAVSEGDIFYEQHAQELGKVVKVWKETAYEIMKKNDGTAVYVPMEGRSNLFFTLECKGNVNSQGYFVNGNRQLAFGNDLKVKSNMILCMGRVSHISEDLD